MKVTKSGGLIAQFIVRLILRDRIKEAQSRDSDLLELMEKICGGNFTDFNLDDEGIMRFGKKGKLVPRYIGPFKILVRICMVSYQLALSSSLSQVYPVFHVSMLRKYISNPSFMLQPQSMKVNKDLSYEEEPVVIIDC